MNEAFSFFRHYIFRAVTLKSAKTAIISTEFILKLILYGFVQLNYTNSKFIYFVAYVFAWYNTVSNRIAKLVLLIDITVLRIILVLFGLIPWKITCLGDRSFIEEKISINLQVLDTSNFNKLSQYIKNWYGQVLFVSIFYFHSVIFNHLYASYKIKRKIMKHAWRQIGHVTKVKLILDICQDNHVLEQDKLWLRSTYTLAWIKVNHYQGHHGSMSRDRCNVRGYYVASQWPRILLCNTWRATEQSVMCALIT